MRIFRKKMQSINASYAAGVQKTCRVKKAGCADGVCGECCTKILNLNVSYGKKRVLEHINLHVHCGELTAIIGPNGGGKSTLLKAILGEVRIQGEIRFSSRGSVDKRPRIGYVPQHVAIDRDLPCSVIDLFALSRGKFPVWMRTGSARRKEALTALGMVSAKHLADRKIGELSGGELQRVLLACAMSPMPEILLLDEPVSGVDAKGLSLFYETICNLRHRYDISIILVTHDIGAIAPHADRLVLLNKTILADGKPAEVLAHSELSAAMGRSFMSTVYIPPDKAVHGENK
jgi:zinc transport system ATP-binding protein